MPKDERRDRKRDGRQPSRDQRGSGPQPKRSRESRSITSVPGGELPRWVRDEIIHTAPKARREPALAHLAKAVDAYASGRFGAAYQQLREAKELAPQAATIRELYGLSAYQLGRWEEALRELRTFRRISGETTQMPVEIDCLRALGRNEDVAKTFEQLRALDPRPETDDEARVVYASALLDRGLATDAWSVIKPGRLIANPRPSTLRRWFVAARVAVAAGDIDTARRLAGAIEKADSEFPALLELRAEIDGA